MSENKPNWMELISGCLAAFLREQAGSSCPVVDYETRSNIAADPDDMRVWFICRTTEEKDEFMSTERSRSVSVLKKKMIAAGFPDSAIASVEVRVTSRDEIAKSGGDSSFFS